MMSILSHPNSALPPHLMSHSQECAPPPLPLLTQEVQALMLRIIFVFVEIRFVFIYHHSFHSIFSSIFRSLLSSSVNRNELLTVIKPGQKPFKFILIRIHFHFQEIIFFYSRHQISWFTKKPQQTLLSSLDTIVKNRSATKKGKASIHHDSKSMLFRLRNFQRIIHGIDFSR